MVRPDIDLGSNSKAAAAAGGCNGGKGGSARGRQSNLGASSSAAHMETAAAEPWSGWFTDGRLKCLSALCARDAAAVAAALPEQHSTQTLLRI